MFACTILCRSLMSASIVAKLSSLAEFAGSSWLTMRSKESSYICASSLTDFVEYIGSGRLCSSWTRLLSRTGSSFWRNSADMINVFLSAFFPKFISSVSVNCCSFCFANSIIAWSCAPRADPARPCERCLLWINLQACGAAVALSAGRCTGETAAPSNQPRLTCRPAAARMCAIAFGPAVGAEAAPDGACHKAPVARILGPPAILAATITLPTRSILRVLARWADGRR
mmetsp:Transcript_34713/g.82234  ORF Transcript_34713/g.82234 Transcript_34713/m.82234 type:complete len:228 (+) Transcript_34713:1024-1707(+)